MATSAETIHPKAAPDGADSAGNASSPERPAGAGLTGAGDEALARVVQGAHDAIDRLAETAAPHVHRLQEGVNAAGDLLGSRADRAREMGDEWAESLRSTVRDNPLAAVATALVVGLIIARLTA